MTVAPAARTLFIDFSTDKGFERQMSNSSCFRAGKDKNLILKSQRWCGEWGYQEGYKCQSIHCVCLQKVIQFDNVSRAGVSNSLKGIKGTHRQFASCKYPCKVD